MKKLFIILCIIFASKSAFASELITPVYKIFEDKYIKKNIIENFAINTLKNLKSIDKEINIANDANKISIYYKTKKIYMVNKPAKNDYKHWAELTNQVIEKLKKISPKLRAQKYNLQATILARTINNYDNKANKFFNNTVDYKELFKHKKTFSYNHKQNSIYIIIKNINQTTLNSLKTVITKNPNAKKIVLDLRDNDGGDLKSALEIIDLFIDEGIVFTTKDRDANTSMHQATKGDIFENKPIEILVNKNTASAAELIAFVLQEQNRATITGTQTYGKNSIQTLYIINGYALAITTDYFYNPELKNLIPSHQHQQNP